MSSKSELKATLQEEKTNHRKEISGIKKMLGDYKIERKTNWKTFKSKMNNEIDKIEKSLSKLNKKNKK